MNHDWQDLAFGSKKALNSLGATFIAPAREISAERFTELVKLYLPKGHIVLGLAKEDYIDGFTDQPQFKTLQLGNIQSVINKVNKSATKFKIHTLAIHQREIKYAIDKLNFSHVIFINGSWKYVFHSTEIFYTLVRSKTPYELVSAFTNEDEAKAFEKSHNQSLGFKPGPYQVDKMLVLADTAAKLSYDHSFQTGAVLGRKTSGGYRFMAYAFNKVVPFQTYAMLHGSTREQHFSPANDLNHYDTIHAETALLITVFKKKLDIRQTTLFVNLLPCPNCARMIAETDIAEVVYRIDHSDGYAVRLLENSNKIVRRLV